MRFFLIIKSGSDYPDLEDDVEAKTRGEAIQYFLDRYQDHGFSRDLIAENIFAEK